MTMRLIRPFLILFLACGLAQAAEKPPAVSPSKPTFLFLVGEKEYGTHETLPEFAENLLKSKGYKVKFVFAKSDERDDPGCHEFPGFKKALADADVLVISTRRRFPPKEDMALIRKWIENGKPVVGIRTASHAFAAREKGEGYVPAEGHVSWDDIDTELFGGKYDGHYKKDPENPTHFRIPKSEKAHPILFGVKPGDLTTVMTSLYRNDDLAKDTTVVLEGYLKTGESEPVAWTREAGRQRIFYTSLGGVDDMKKEWCRRVLVNALEWAAGLDPVGKPSAPRRR